LLRFIFDARRNSDNQCDAPKSRVGRFMMESLLAATSVIAGVIRAKHA
jgi:hypothetical protein